MGRRARTLVEAEFGWSPIARTLVAAYRSLALEDRQLPREVPKEHRGAYARD